MSEVNIDHFTQLIRQKGEELYRDMPWRQDTQPYYVLVSELMLQQTQVSRVIPKFEAFICRFPDVNSLASATLADVLTMWQGLGYNRRAKFLHMAAKMIASDFDGHFPQSDSDLMKLPGVGKNTAGAIRAYVFNQPSIFIETNVRTVYIHHFLADTFDVTDTQIAELVEATIDRDDPRRFYQNIMDYGSWLKANGVRNISSSQHYKKQSPLEGSVRQVRGQIIRQLAQSDMPERLLKEHLSADERFDTALQGLIADGLIEVKDDVFYLTK